MYITSGIGSVNTGGLSSTDEEKWRWRGEAAISSLYQPFHPAVDFPTYTPVRGLRYTSTYTPYPLTPPVRGLRNTITYTPYPLTPPVRGLRYTITYTPYPLTPPYVGSDIQLLTTHHPYINPRTSRTWAQTYNYLQYT